IRRTKTSSSPPTATTTPAARRAPASWTCSPPRPAPRGGAWRLPPPGAGAGAGVRCLRSPAPDVLRTSEPPLSPARPSRRASGSGSGPTATSSCQAARLSSCASPSGGRPGACARAAWTSPSPARSGPRLLPPPPAPARSLSEDSGSRLVSAAAAQGACYATLKVYPQYRTGLPTETSVKLRVTHQTSAREMVRLVVQEMNEVSQRLLGNPERFVYGKEQLEAFGLVLVRDDSEEWLRDDARPLDLQSPGGGAGCVRERPRWARARARHHRLSVPRAPWARPPARRLLLSCSPGSLRVAGDVRLFVRRSVPLPS
ncbi:hypothetical protein ANANG_G00290300, partial [Anguilla anguilla]